MVQIPDIREGIERSFEKKRQVIRHQSNWASKIGEPCLRKHYYYWEEWDKATPWSDSSIGTVDSGKFLEGKILTIFNDEIGPNCNPPMRIIGTQQATKDSKDTLLERYKISGKIDGFLQVFDMEKGHFESVAVVDIKSANSQIWKSLSNYDSLQRYWWMKEGYIPQVTIYNLGFNCETCALLFADVRNLWNQKLITWPLDLGLAESLLQKANAINQAVKSGIIPRKLNQPDVCGRCDFLSLCNPELTTGQDMQIATQEIDELVHTVLSLEDSKKTYEAAMKQLKSKIVQGQEVSCSKALIQWKHIQGTKKPTAGGPYDQWRMQLVRLGE